MENRVKREELVASPEPMEQMSDMLQEFAGIFKDLNDAGQKAALAMLKGLVRHEKYKTK